MEIINGKYVEKLKNIKMDFYSGDIINETITTNISGNDVLFPENATECFLINLHPFIIKEKGYVASNFYLKINNIELCTGTHQYVFDIDKKKIVDKNVFNPKNAVGGTALYMGGKPLVENPGTFNGGKKGILIQTDNNNIYIQGLSSGASYTNFSFIDNIKDAIILYGLSATKGVEDEKFSCISCPNYSGMNENKCYLLIYTMIPQNESKYCLYKK